MKGVDKLVQHEQINEKTVALSIKGAKLTGQLLAKAMQAFLKKAREPTHKKGKQSYNSLKKSGASLADIDIGDKNDIGTFNKVARRYKVDFAPKIDKSTDPPKWVVFFKAKDDKSLQSAFNEYSRIMLKHKVKKPSMLEKLRNLRELAKTPLTPARNRNRGGIEL